MLARARSVALLGTEACLVDVEVFVSNTGLPSFSIVGLPTISVREAEQRTRAAILAIEEEWPRHRIVANLAPGEVRKEGTHFDLPIALGVLAGSGRIELSALEDWIAVGELALDGSLRPVRGTLAAAMECRRTGRRGILCPDKNAPEAALVEGIEVIPLASLRDCVRFLGGDWSPPTIEAVKGPPDNPVADLIDVRGQPYAKRALEIAAAGGHNLLPWWTPRMMN